MASVPGAPSDVTAEDGAVTSAVRYGYEVSRRDASSRCGTLMGLGGGWGCTYGSGWAQINKTPQVNLIHNITDNIIGI